MVVEVKLPVASCHAVAEADMLYEFIYGTMALVALRMLVVISYLLLVSVIC